MSLQNLLLKNTAFTQKLLENIPESVLIKLGKRKAYNTFKEACEVKAYKNILKENSIDKNNIRSVNDFNKLPIIDKQNYVKSNKLSNILKVDFCDNYTIEESSGYGGRSFYWLRYSGQDNGFCNYMELGMKKSYTIHKNSTLLINTFALGTWVTGVKFSRAACEVANKKSNKMTVVNTGMMKDSALRALKTFPQYYEQTILVGYPPFIKEIVEICKEEKILGRIENLHILTGAEAFPEEWRDYISELISVDIDKSLSRIMSAYGAADVGLELGYEQPITVLFRRLLRDNDEIRHEVLGEEVDYVPHFFQYNPLNIWVETYKGELLFTANAGIPIVRYNLHDSGGVISFNSMLDFLSKKYKIEDILQKYKPFHLPVLYLRGRTDGVIPVSGAIVYVEQIKAALENAKIQDLVTGRFYSYSDYDEKLLPRFHIIIEVDSLNKIRNKEKEVERVVIKTLCGINQDYNAFYEDKPEQYRPHFKFIGQEEFDKYHKDSLKIKYVDKGKQK